MLRCHESPAGLKLGGTVWQSLPPRCPMGLHTGSDILHTSAGPRDLTHANLLCTADESYGRNPTSILAPPNGGKGRSHMYRPTFAGKKGQELEPKLLPLSHDTNTVNDRHIDFLGFSIYFPGNMSSQISWRG